MVQHHPPTDFLTEYAAGVLPVAQSACVAAHLSYCQRCRQVVDRLEDIGGAQLEQPNFESSHKTGLRSVTATKADFVPRSGRKNRFPPKWHIDLFLYECEP